MNMWVKTNHHPLPVPPDILTSMPVRYASPQYEKSMDNVWRSSIVDRRFVVSTVETPKRLTVSVAADML